MNKFGMKFFDTTEIEKLQKYLHYHQSKVIKMNTLQVKKHCQVTKTDKQKKLNSLIGNLEKHLETKPKRLKIKKKNK